MAFRDDESAKTTKMRISNSKFEDYLVDILLRDGHLPLHNPPILKTLKGLQSTANPSEGKSLEILDFCNLLENYWVSSSFKLFNGEPSIIDIICYLGKKRSAHGEQYLPAFKAMSSEAVNAIADSLLKSGDIRNESLQFFHVYDEKETDVLSFHTHTILFLK